MKKLLSLALALILVLSLGAVAFADGATKADPTEGIEPAEPNGEKLVVWTLADDLVDFGARYQAATGTEMEVVVIAPEDYPTKVQTALVGGESEPDIIVGEPQMLGDMFSYGAFADLDALGAEDYADQIVDYVWAVGKDPEGVQRAISYQITPAGIYYRRDIAEKVFGTDDPDEIGKYFADYPTILETAQTLKDAGYRIFSSDSEINFFSGLEPWVVDGKLNLAQARLDYMDLVVALYQGDLTAYANQWSTPWYQAMSGPVPILTADIQNYADDSVNVWDAEAFAEQTADMQQTEVFAFGLPSWGVLTLRDNVGETSGLWGVCAGPEYGMSGGTFIGISELSEKKELAWDFVKFCTLNEDTAEWWITFSEGDTVSMKSVLEAHKDDENPVYGNQKLYAFWQKQAEGIDYSKVTQYDKIIGDAWGAAISAVKTGVSTKEDAIEEFYDTVAYTYPEIEIVR